jgi:hypothetical protein
VQEIFSRLASLNESICMDLDRYFEQIIAFVFDRIGILTSAWSDSDTAALLSKPAYSSCH